MEATKPQNPIRVPSNHIRGWQFAHGHLIAHTLNAGCWDFMILHSGHHLYGYSADSDIDHFTDPETQTPEFFAEEYADCDRWTEAIRDIPALYAYYEPY